MVTNIQPLTEAYLEQLESDGKRYEVVDGELREVGMTGENHGWLEFRLLLLIGTHVEAHKLGRCYPGDVDFVLDGEPGDIRIRYQPDVAFVKAQNVVSTTGLIYRAPDLAVEIISPSQTYEDVREKCNDYLQFGSQQVWIVIARTQEIEVRFPDGRAQTYKIGDTLDGGDVLPGLTIAIAKVFEDAV